jgi:hypothetical protein
MFQQKPKHGSRIEQLQAGDKALADGNLAKALMYYSMATLIRAYDNNTSTDAALIEAKEKLEVLKNKIAEQEMQKAVISNAQLTGSKTI